MNRDFNDELLSAYLDGELAPSERSAVENELATNAQARRLL
ncbi:MAG TPA: zf-HC2 domain-containing protein, partial [Pirellulaceae bacterium]|nr:zf-HC2 domain-containing protein [Pirellulaceae bacterium]